MRIPLWGRRFCLQRQGSVFDDTLHDEGGAKALDAWEGGEAVVVDLLEGGQVGGDDAQKIVGLAEEPLGLPDVRDGGDSLLERVDGGTVSATHGDEDQSLEGQAESLGVQVCVVAADRAGAFQGAQAAVAGRKAEADSLREFGEGQAPVLLELGKNLPIYWVHIHDSSHLHPRDWRIFGNTFGPFCPNLSRLVSQRPIEIGRSEWRVMAGGTIAAFWAVSLLFVITPGADWAYAIAAGLRHRGVLPAVGGLLVGHLAATAVVAAGVGALVARSPLVLTVLTAVGATYLMWLGLGMLAHPAAPRAHSQEPGGSWLRQAAKGAGISGLNPKVFLLFLALLPQFTDPDAAWPIAAQIVVLGLVHVASCAVVYTGVGTGARRVLRARPTAARAVTRFSGTAMIVIGVVLLAEQLIG
jgi:threonine/homoserine/homoserine lactone efflux protein